MRIALWHNLPGGGAMRVARDLARGLFERGHNVEVWRPPTTECDLFQLDDAIAVHVVPLVRARCSVRALVATGLERYVPSISWLDALSVHARQCAAEIDRRQFDVLLAHPCRLTRVPMIGRFARLPKVLYLQEPNRWLYEARPSLPWAAGPRLRGPAWWPSNLARIALDLARVEGLRVLAREESASARAFDRILVNSLFSRESVLRSYGLRARVSYLGVDVERFVDLGLARQDFVLGVSSIVRHKGIELAIQAVAMVGSPRPTLVWAAARCPDAGYLAHLRDLAQTLDVRFDVRLAIADHDLVHLLNTAAMVLYVPDLEPFGLVPLEAGACGAAVIGSAEGGLRETIEDGVNGLLVEHDAHAIAATIGRLRAQPEVARKLGQRACQQVRARWNLPAAVERLETRLIEAARA
jgi:glycosyltransferase involved in cell wall biosynthesis